MSWNFSSSGPLATIRQDITTFKQQTLPGLPHPERDTANSAMDLINACVSSAGTNTVNVSASGSQDPETDHAPNAKPTLNISITS